MARLSRTTVTTTVFVASAKTNQHKHTYTHDNDETNEQSLNRGQYMVVVLFSVLLVIRKILVANSNTNDALD